MRHWQRGQLMTREEAVIIDWKKQLPFQSDTIFGDTGACGHLNKGTPSSKSRGQKTVMILFVECIWVSL